MSSSHPQKTENCQATTSAGVYSLFTHRGFRAFRWALPFLILLSIGLWTGFTIIPLEFVLLVPLLVALCTTTTRYLAAPIASLFKSGPHRVLIELQDDTLSLRLEQDNYDIPLQDCRDIHIHHWQWWIVPALSFSIQTKNGAQYSLRTTVDIPEMRQALLSIQKSLKAQNP